MASAIKLNGHGAGNHDEKFMTTSMRVIAAFVSRSQIVEKKYTPDREWHLFSGLHEYELAARISRRWKLGQHLASRFIWHSDPKVRRLRSSKVEFVKFVSHTAGSELSLEPVETLIKHTAIRFVADTHTKPPRAGSCGNGDAVLQNRVQSMHRVPAFAGAAVLYMHGGWHHE